MTLLEKTRKINAMLQNAAGKTVNFKEMADTLTDVIEANTYIVSRKGKLLGYSEALPIENDRMKQMLTERQFPEEYTQSLFNVGETSSNLEVSSQYTAFPIENSELFTKGLTTIVPIVGGGERLGTLILSRLESNFTDDDLLLAEYGGTVVGMEIFMKKQKKLKKKLVAVPLCKWRLALFLTVS